MNDTLIIHITKEFQNIVNIIKTSSFMLAYCGEVFNSGDDRISSAAHPMVCFSEYCFDELEGKKITYGKYGIAFTKEWAEKMKLNPVLYVEKNSQVAKALGELLKARQGRINGLSLPNQLRLPIIQLKCFTKNVRGYNSYFEDDSFYFKAENEWRYVPKLDEIDGNYISQHLSKYNQCPEFYNGKVRNYPLEFDKNDLKMVFVSNEKEFKYLSEHTTLNKNKIQICKWEYIQKKI